MLVDRELGEAPEPWLVHDLRRTCGRRLSQLRVPTEIAELVIGHTEGIAAVYNQHDPG